MHPPTGPALVSHFICRLKGSNRKPEMSLTIQLYLSATRATAALVVSIRDGYGKTSCSDNWNHPPQSSASETNSELAASIATNVNDVGALANHCSSMSNALSMKRTATIAEAVRRQFSTPSPASVAP